MDRVHAFEFEDLPWVPAPVRDGARDLLDTLFARARFYRALAPTLAKLLDETGLTSMSDVCSGSGGGAVAMLSELDALGRRGVSLSLSDLFPNESARARIGARGDERIRYLAEPADALNAPAQPGAVRTMFGALHHFRPADVARILTRAVEARAPIAIFDVAASRVLRRLPLPLASIAAVPNAGALFVLALLLVPWARPLRVSRVALSYGLPLIPATFAWDGTISAMRAYTPDELLAIARAVPGVGTYAWRCVREGNALALIGRPTEG
jgi:hypothetical protein